MPAGFEAFVTANGVDPAVGPWFIVARGLD